MLGQAVWAGAKLATKYVLLPVAVSLATALVADALAQRLRARTARLRGDAHQETLDRILDPSLQPAP